MNDEIREQLSAYLDGALSESERRELESRLQGSEELRRELEDLRGVARAIRDLPKEPLPDGFIARLQARQARGDQPRRDWVFLPPSVRPVVLALSCGCVALWIWQDVVVRQDPAIPHGPAAKVLSSEEAPISQINVSGAAAGGANEPAAAADKMALGFGAGAAGGSSSGRLAPKPAMAKAKGHALIEEANGPTPESARSNTMTEEERSARNESMIADLERQKKQMGIARIAPDEDAGPRARQIAALRGAGIQLGERVPSPVIGSSAPNLDALQKDAKAEAMPAMAAAPAAAAAAPESDESAVAARRGAAAAPSLAAPAAPASPEGRLAPDAGLVFADARGFSSSWILLGLPRDPPAVDFTSHRAVLLKPSASKIVSVTPGDEAIVVVFRSLRGDETPDPAADRFAEIPLAPRPVTIIDITPR